MSEKRVKTEDWRGKDQINQEARDTTHEKCVLQPACCWRRWDGERLPWPSWLTAWSTKQHFRCADGRRTNVACCCVPLSCALVHTEASTGHMGYTAQQLVISSVLSLFIRDFLSLCHSSFYLCLCLLFICFLCYLILYPFISTIIVSFICVYSYFPCSFFSCREPGMLS
jgi:hypothetical protein